MLDYQPYYRFHPRYYSCNRFTLIYKISKSYLSRGNLRQFYKDETILKYSLLVTKMFILLKKYNHLL